MATPPKPYARNDLFALKEARRHTRESTHLADRAMDEIDRMREGMGRPDYGRLTQLLGQLAMSLSKSSGSLEEMWVIRAQAKQVEEEAEIAAQLAEMKTQIATLQHAIQQRGMHA